jgi:hypothetical protein
MEATLENDTVVNENLEEEIYYSNKNTKYYNDTKIILKQLLNSSCSNKMHTENVMAQPTLKDAHIYCKYNNLSGQFTGPVLEKYIKIKYKMTKNNASLCTGDLRCNEINVEIKALRPKYGDKCWIELLNYRIDEISI